MKTSDLSTERLRLRLCAPEDVPVLHALWCGSEVRRYLWDDRVIDRAEAAAAVDSCLKMNSKTDSTARPCMWLVEASADGVLVGFVALRAIEPTSEVELIYGLAPEFWNRGFATEAAAAVLAYCFEVLELPRVWARTDLPNAASIRVMQRLGMKRGDDPGETSFVTYVSKRQR